MRRLLGSLTFLNLSEELIELKVRTLLEIARDAGGAAQGDEEVHVGLGFFARLALTAHPLRRPVGSERRSEGSDIVSRSRRGGRWVLLSGGDSDAAATTLLLVSSRVRCSTAAVFRADAVGQLADEGVEGRGGLEEEPRIVHPHVAIRNERRAVVRVMVPTGGVVVLPLGQQSFELVPFGLEVGCAARVNEALGIDVGDFRGGDERIGLEVRVVELLGDLNIRVCFPGVDLGSRPRADESTQGGAALGIGKGVRESRELVGHHLGVVLVRHAAHANAGVHGLVIVGGGVHGVFLGGVLGGVLGVGHLVGGSEKRREPGRHARGEE